MFAIRRTSKEIEQLTKEQEQAKAAEKEANRIAYEEKMRRRAENEKAYAAAFEAKISAPIMLSGTETAEKEGKILYYRNVGEESRIKSEAESAAKALNAVYEHFKFKNVSEIPANVQEWITKRTLETNPKLAKLAQIHKLETLKYTVPDWIQESGRAFSLWHSVKNNHMQSIQYCALENEHWVVDYEMLENEFEKSPAYRRYLDKPEQLKRLEQCRRFIQLMKDTGINYHSHFFQIFGIKGNPWVRIIGDKMIPCKEYILTGEILSGTPTIQNRNYYLDGWQLTE